VTDGIYVRHKLLILILLARCLGSVTTNSLYMDLFLICLTGGFFLESPYTGYSWRQMRTLKNLIRFLPRA
jgi:hypothetical protein